MSAPQSLGTAAAEDALAPQSAGLVAPLPFDIDESPDEFDDTPAAGAPVSADSPPEGDSEAEDAADPAGAARPRREFTHPNQVNRYLRNALARGDTDALERIQRDPETSKTYAALADAIETRAIERAQAIADAERAFTDLEQLRQFDRDTFSERLADPEVADFYAQMRRWKTDHARRAPSAPASPLTSFYRTLRADPEAAALSDEDWERLDPDNYSQYEPAAAQIRMTRDLDRLIVQRKTRPARPADPNAVNKQAVRDAVRNAPPAVGGTPPVNLSDREIREAYLSGVQQGRVPDHIKTAYRQMRQRKGFVAI